MKTLIGVGCSHTQASAFIKFPITGNGYELITDALKEKYEMEYVTEKWITENLTWMGKLNKNLKYDKILNFGRMGMGIEANIRSLMSYTYKVKDLSNHLIIFLVPEMERKEIIHRKEKSYDFFNNKGYPNYRIDTQWDINDNKGDMSIYFDKFYNEEFESYKLGETREIKIQLPRNYDENIDQSYPLFIVFDGDYMFEVVAGNVDYYSYWEDMPEAIVVGINQSETRDDDCYYSEQNDLPIESGADFFEFIGMELIPHIENNYRTENFRVAVGHGETANFINYFMLKAKPLFQAYIVISPSLAPSMNDYISQRLQQYETRLFYYLATASNDIKSIKKDTETLNATITSIDNKNILYNFDNFEGATHYSAPAHAIPKALESIFYVFQPISKKEYKESILTLETSPVEYLLDKYKVISDLFGIDKQILINDFKAIAAAINVSPKPPVL